MPTRIVSFQMDPSLKARLTREARLAGRSPGHIAQEAIKRYLDAKEDKRECIREAATEINKGVFISAKAVDAWMRSWDTENELPPPESDIFPPGYTGTKSEGNE